MKVLFTIAILLLFVLGSMGQQMLSVKKGLINTTKGRQIKVTNLRQVENQFIYTNTLSKEINSIDINEVLRIDKKVGNNAVLYGVGLGAAGFLGALLGASMNPNYSNNKEQKWDDTLSLTTISALVGVIWGATVHKYKTVYRKSRQAEIFKNKLKVSLRLSEVKQVHLTYRF